MFIQLSKNDWKVYFLKENEKKWDPLSFDIAPPFVESIKMEQTGGIKKGYFKKKIFWNIFQIKVINLKTGQGYNCHELIV